VKLFQAIQSVSQACANECLITWRWGQKQLLACCAAGSVKSESVQRSKRPTAGHAPHKWEPESLPEPSESKRSRGTRQTRPPTATARVCRPRFVDGTDSTLVHICSHKLWHRLCILWHTVFNATVCSVCRTDKKQRLVQVPVGHSLHKVAKRWLQRWRMTASLTQRCSGSPTLCRDTW
jgi:hypothetical protein